MSHFALFLYFPFKFSLSYSLLLTFFIYSVFWECLVVQYFSFCGKSHPLFNPKIDFFLCFVLLVLGVFKERVVCYPVLIHFVGNIFFSLLLFRNHKTFIAFFTNLFFLLFLRVHLKYLLYTQKFTSFNLKKFSTSFLHIYQHKWFNDSFHLSRTIF